ncbi:MAG: 4-hydroxy-tetrahydrodipicolinate synthase [Spirochaetales bacterium]|jgi:4-hydroxy-tetrahydrodipicolinate synthase|nr:4-hydroxy-tetrahydrodipicolinate synthase [Spirochaetales bacterium]
MNFKGVYTALVTPFTQDGELDEKALRNIVDRQIEYGVSGLVPMGTTGESPTVDHKENIKVVEIVVNQAAGRVPVIAGTGSNSTREAVEMTVQAEKVGADASLQVAPYYNKPTPEGYYQHFAAVADAVDIPIVVYNIVSRTAKNIDNETMLRIAELSGVQGVKESSGDMLQVTDLVMRAPSSLDIVSGDDNLAIPIIALGGTGVVSVASNLIPSEMSEMIASALDGDFIKAREIHYRLLPLFQALFLETNPIPVKAAMAELGFIEETYRLPMCRMSDAPRAALMKIIRNMDIQ